MFTVLYFITPFVFLILAVLFPLGVTRMTGERPGWLNMNIGRLNADDICALSDENRKYLRNQVICHFAAAVALTFLVGLAFAVSGSAKSGLTALTCNMLGLAIGLAITFRLIKKANELKDISA